MRRRAVSRIVTGILVAALTLLSGMSLVREMVRSEPQAGIGGVVGAMLDGAERSLLSWGQPYLLRFIDPFRTVNGYGLFRAMTTSRPEIVIEGSRDGLSWQPYEFRWKPGELARRPRLAAPHQPRLDWQMWFAALNPRRAAPWLQGLALRLLQGSPDVLALLRDNPFPERPPRFVRLAYYRYTFTSPGPAASGGAWWTRESLGHLTGPLSLEDFR